MRTLEHILLHTDTPELTYHQSVALSDVLPLVVDFNDKHVIGRAHVWRDGGNLMANLYVDKDVKDLSPLALIATDGTNLFTYEGVQYGMEGHFSQVSVVTKKAEAQMYAHEWEPEESDAQDEAA